MSILLSGVLHKYQPFRDLWDVTFIPLKERYSGSIAPRKLIPLHDGRQAEDWNSTVTDECYAICANEGVFSSLAFNIGPTLLKDLWIRRRDVYDKIIQSEQESFDRLGHSNALAQASPNHAIVPLAKDDKLVHIQWGIQEYVEHYKKFPEGVWLPEAAVNKETLSILANAEIKYVVLAPKQASRVRPVGGDENSWQEVNEHTIDPSKPYKVILGNRKEIAVFFYDRGFSEDLAFPKGNPWYYESSENFIHRWLGAKGDFKHFGVDGETFGHHIKGKAQLLSGAVKLINSEPQRWQDARFTNYGSYLKSNPPDMEVEVHENSSWSCSLKLNRWGEEIKIARSNGEHRWDEVQHCHYGITNRHPQWRVQLRKALDSLGEAIDGIYIRYANKYFKNPEIALHEYGQVVSNSQSFYKFMEIQGKKGLSKKDIDDAYKLLEMEKFKLYMSTSCGWFHEYVSRIEPFTNFICANSAIRIAEYFKPNTSIEAAFLASLSEDTRFSEDMKKIYWQAKNLNSQYFNLAA